MQTLSDLIMVPMETIKQRMQLNMRPYKSIIFILFFVDFLKTELDLNHCLYCRCTTLYKNSFEE